MKNYTESIKAGEVIIAKVARMGAKRGCAWRYVEYRAKASAKTGYVFSRVLTGTLFPNIANSQWSKEFEANCGRIVVYGRPVSGKNAPTVVLGLHAALPHRD